MLYFFVISFKNISQNETFTVKPYSKLVGGKAMDQYIQQALAGDEMAIWHITTMYKPRLLAKANSYMKNKQDAEDIVQETFIKAFGALAQLKEPKYFATWLYKILIRESFSAMKKKKRTELLEVEIMEQLLLLDQKTARITASCITQ